MPPPYPLPWPRLQARHEHFYSPVLVARPMGRRRGRLDHGGAATLLDPAGGGDHGGPHPGVDPGVFVIGAAAVAGLIGGQALPPELALDIGSVLLVAIAGPLAGIGVA